MAGGIVLDFVPNVCVREELTPEEYCTDIVCPAVEVLAKEAVPALCTAFAGISCEATMIGMLDMDVEECAMECEREECDLTLDVLACAGDPAACEVEGNQKTCTVAIACTGSLISPTICRAPDGDPPMLTGGLASVMFGHRTIGVLDESASTVSLSVGALDTDISVSGSIAIVGPPCPGASCDVGLGLNLRGPAIFDFAGFEVTDTRLFGGSGANLMTLNTAGTGVLAPGEVTATIMAAVDGTETGFVAPNISPVTLETDFVGNTFHVFDGFTRPADADTPEISMVVDLVGTLVNQPPTADAGPDQVLECTSPAGAEVVLDGSGSSDPDGDLVLHAWFENDPENGLDIGDVLTAQAPLGVTFYGLGVYDEHFQGDFDVTAVTVEDTTAPTLTEFAYKGPVCLSPPNHKYVVLTVDREFRGMVTDICDPSAHLEILSASSDQPDNGVGDGNTSADLVVFPDHICVRAERTGTDPAGRTYRVDLAAVDASGNASDPTVFIRVAHDQSDQDCPMLEPTVFVDEGDPLCTPLTAATAAGCAIVAPGAGSTGGLFLLALAVAAATLGRRKRRG